MAQGEAQAVKDGILKRGQQAVDHASHPDGLGYRPDGALGLLRQRKNRPLAPAPPGGALKDKTRI